MQCQGDNQGKCQYYGVPVSELTWGCSIKDCVLKTNLPNGSRGGPLLPFAADLVEGRRACRPASPLFKDKFEMMEWESKHLQSNQWLIATPDYLIIKTKLPDGSFFCEEKHYPVL